MGTHYCAWAYQFVARLRILLLNHSLGKRQGDLQVDFLQRENQVPLLGVVGLFFGLLVN